MASAYKEPKNRAARDRLRKDLMTIMDEAIAGALQKLTKPKPVLSHWGYSRTISDSDRCAWEMQ